MQQDALLLSMVELHGLNQWTKVASAFPGRESKQCCERYGRAPIVLSPLNFGVHGLKTVSYRYKHHLSPDIIKDAWTRHDDLAIVKGHSLMGNKWAEM